MPGSTTANDVLWGGSGDDIYQFGAALALGEMLNDGVLTVLHLPSFVNMLKWSHYGAANDARWTMRGGRGHSHWAALAACGSTIRGASDGCCNS